MCWVTVLLDGSGQRAYALRVLEGTQLWKGSFAVIGVAAWPLPWLMRKQADMRERTHAMRGGASVVIGGGSDTGRSLVQRLPRQGSPLALADLAPRVATWSFGGRAR